MKTIILLVPFLAFAQPRAPRKVIDPSKDAPAAAASAPAVVPEAPAAVPATSDAAVTIAKQWQEGDPLAAPGDNGAVVYRWGAGMAPIICAPERLTTIALEAGEKISSAPVLGDTVRWEYQLMTAGAGPTERTSVVIKPKRPGISTDLVLATDRRTYQLLLVSKEKEHLSQVSFSYPSDSKWDEYQAQQRDRAEAEKKTNTVTTLDGPTNFGYTVNAQKGIAFVPRAVYDDGHQTYLKMPPEAEAWETPVLQVGSPNGCEITNYRADGDTWVIDRLFTQAELISGTGKKARRVIIRRDGAQKVSCKR